MNIIIITFAILMLLIIIYKSITDKQKCIKCGYELEVESINDNLGFNLSKKIVITARHCSRGSVTYVCKSCKTRYKLENKGSKLIEIK